MTSTDPNTDYANWQELYSPAESRWQDLKRMDGFFFPIAVLIFFATMYAVIGYVFIHFEEWIPVSFTQYTYYRLILRVSFLILLPVIAMMMGLDLIFRRASEFVFSIYQPPEEEKLVPLIKRRLLGMPPFPPPLDTMLKYPSVVVNEPMQKENHWSRWLGGPAILVIYDGIALYLERGSKFSRVVGPGLPMPLLERYERIREVVDLRPQTKEDIIKPWTKDGIRIQLTIRAEFQIAASHDAIEKSSKFRYPFDPLAIKAAVEFSSVRLTDGKLYEQSWLEGAWGTITGYVNAFVAGHSLDELFLAPQIENRSNSNDHNYETEENIEQILSYRILKQVTNKIQNSLQNNGIRVLNLQIIHVELPETVRELRTKYWETVKQKISAQRNSRAEAERIRAREFAHAEAQRIMLMTITNKLEAIDPQNLTEPLILSLSGILEQGLDDPIIRPLIAKESFAVLERMRKLLREQF